MSRRRGCGQRRCRAFFGGLTYAETGVKMVDGCGFPEGNPVRAYWAFYGALTNAETRIRVTQLLTGEVDEWFNPVGAPVD
ncbi:MAG TPA: hypothetical protein VMV46_04805 [Thermoanaerobaculia bacterium]|nr:hypothetical protein [Thermoanaerobaculia bacterium]